MFRVLVVLCCVSRSFIIFNRLNRSSSGCLFSFGDIWMIYPLLTAVAASHRAEGLTSLYHWSQNILLNLLLRLMCSAVIHSTSSIRKKNACLDLPSAQWVHGHSGLKVQWNNLLISCTVRCPWASWKAPPNKIYYYYLNMYCQKKINLWIASVCVSEKHWNLSDEGVSLSSSDMNLFKVFVLDLSWCPVHFPILHCGEVPSCYQFPFWIACSDECCFHWRPLWSIVVNSLWFV